MKNVLDLGDISCWIHWGIYGLKKRIVRPMSRKHQNKMETDDKTSIYICVHLSIYLSIYPSIYLSIYIYIYIYIYCVCVYIYIYIWEIIGFPIDNKAFWMKTDSSPGDLETGRCLGLDSRKCMRGYLYGYPSKNKPLQCWMVNGQWYNHNL